MKHHRSCDLPKATEHEDGAVNNCQEDEHYFDAFILRCLRIIICLRWVNIVNYWNAMVKYQLIHLLVTLLTECQRLYQLKWLIFLLILQISIFLDVCYMNFLLFHRSGVPDSFSISFHKFLLIHRLYSNLIGKIINFIVLIFIETRLICLNLPS